MADQEFLASFAVKIDEAGVSRLQAERKGVDLYPGRPAGHRGAVPGA